MKFIMKLNSHLKKREAKFIEKYGQEGPCQKMRNSYLLRDPEPISKIDDEPRLLSARVLRSGKKSKLYEIRQISPSHSPAEKR